MEFGGELLDSDRGLGFGKGFGFPEKLPPVLSDRLLSLLSRLLESPEGSVLLLAAGAGGGEGLDEGSMSLTLLYFALTGFGGAALVLEGLIAVDGVRVEFSSSPRGLSASSSSPVTGVADFFFLRLKVAGFGGGTSLFLLGVLLLLLLPCSITERRGTGFGGSVELSSFSSTVLRCLTGLGGVLLAFATGKV